ncbi:hypothetical protein PIB30_093942 [Stylosanthes scabra]|uniref:Protein FAR1-RELATED SEQUENCE n=1 Tax=Stylosanthes scabra TaxID=79078 RepID=A0ABU6UU65_9FABA|nr:hypothetical protein [Stylosanthes scabra]
MHLRCVPGKYLKRNGINSILFVRKESIPTIVIYTLTKFGGGAREYKVKFDRSMGKFYCDCLFWNRLGIPCTHMFYVMKQEDVPKIPDRMVLKRWGKNIKS